MSLATRFKMFIMGIDCGKFFYWNYAFTLEIVEIIGFELK